MGDMEVAIPSDQDKVNNNPCFFTSLVNVPMSCILFMC